MVVTEVFGGKFRYETVDARIDEPDWVGRDGTIGRTLPAFVCTSLVEEAKWDEEYGFWYLPYVTGELPRAHIAADGTAEIVDPDIPTCICEETGHEHEGRCGAITWHVIPGAPPAPRCSNCSPGIATALTGGS